MAKPPSIRELLLKIQILELNQQWLNRVLIAYGLPIGTWLSPFKAASVLGVSLDRIKLEVERAERLRALGKKGDIVYGQHYRNGQDPEAQQASWQINVVEFSKILDIPPDQRKVT
ncbi:hypothetical protein [Leptolyngbya sp. CCY15150]|uniref:hypothetical protein n=1 Tax=Leptolyngbya sp. CCY15150 TaxID=2767772 RepID=UPI0019510E10|nr:hypothetical protein [Leptolyngbya sp. CCY15150]